MEAFSYKTFTIKDDEDYHYTVEVEDTGGIQLTYVEHPNFGASTSRVGMSPAVARLVAKALIELADEEEGK